MLRPFDAQFARNLGFISVSEQEKLNTSVVAIAGAGGDGGAIAEQLARCGIGEIRLADPDNFEIENVNRQVACTSKTLGCNKSLEVGKHISEINPKVKVVTHPEGVTSKNVVRFLDKVDLLIDETEFTKPHIGTLLARQARKNKLSTLMALNVGFGCLVTSFHPEGRSFEEVMGIGPNLSLRKVRELRVPLKRWLPYIPSYLDFQVFKRVELGEKPAPSIAPGVAIASAVAATQAILHLTQGLDGKRKSPTYAPHYISVDIMTGVYKLIRYPLASHHISYFVMLLRYKLGLNPKIDY